MIGPDFRDEQDKPLPSSQLRRDDSAKGQAAQDAEPSIYQHMLREVRGARFAEMQNNAPFHEAWLLLAALLTVFGLALSNRALTTMSLFMLVISLGTWTWNRLSLFGLHYQRKFSHTRAFVGESITLTLETRNQKFLPLTWVTITDIFAADLPIRDETLSMNQSSQQAEFLSFWMLGAFQRLTRNFTIECAKRGFHRYGPAKISTGDAFGFFSSRGLPPERDLIIVYPKLYPAEVLGLPPKNPFGNFTAPVRLFEDPLRTIGIRNWQSSDTMRRIHWKATARHQRLLSRVYEPSEETQIIIFLNVATMRRHWQGHFPELMERAISVAASLAQLSLEDRLATGMIANGRLPGSDQPLRILPSRSQEQLTAILELLAAVTPFASVPIEALILREAPRLSWGATLLVVTAILPEELLLTLLELDRAGRKIVLISLAAEAPKLEGYVHNLHVHHLPMGNEELKIKN